RTLFAARALCDAFWSFDQAASFGRSALCKRRQRDAAQDPRAAGQQAGGDRLAEERDRGGSGQCGREDLQDCSPRGREVRQGRIPERVPEAGGDGTGGKGETSSRNGESRGVRGGEGRDRPERAGERRSAEERVGGG